MTPYPYFKYHPKAYTDGTFKEYTAICDVCSKETNLVYDNSFYAAGVRPIICPFCVANGGACRKYKGEFHDVYPNSENVESIEIIDELTHRTPTYCSWQQQEWLVHCNDFCAFDEYVGWEEIDHLDIRAEIEEDIQNHFPEGFAEEIKKYLYNSGGMQGYLFKCLHCNKYRLWVDCD